MKRRSVYVLSGLGFSLLVATYLIAQIDLATFIEILAQVSPWMLLLAFICYVALNLSRAWRFSILLAKPIPTLHLVPVTLYYNFLVRTLPLMSGEVSYAFLLRRYLGQPFTEGLGGVLVARVFDLILVLLGGGISLLTVGAEDQSTTEILILLGGALLVLLVFHYSGSLWRRVGRIGLGLIRRATPGLAESLSTYGGEVMEQVRRLLSWRILLPTASITLLIYFFNVFYALVIIRTLGVKADLGVLLLVITLGMLASNIPVSFAGFGITAASWTLSLSVIAEVDLSLAASAGLLINGLQIIFVVLTGFAGYLWLQYVPYSITRTT